MQTTIINTILTTLTGTFIGYLITKIKSFGKEDSEVKCAVTSLLRSEITGYYYRSVARGYLRQWEKENIIYLYESYRKLGGNSYVKIIIKEIEELPVEK